MKTFKQFQEGIFDFLPKGKFEQKPYDYYDDSHGDSKKYKTPVIKKKPPGVKYNMPVLPGEFPKPDPYKTTLA